MNIKKIVSALCMLVVLAVVFSACSESTLDASSAEAENKLQPFATQSNGNNSVTSLARGSGHFSINGELRSFTFTANEKADGSIGGNWQFHSRISDVKANGEITCMEVHNGITYVGGFMKKGIYSSEPNNEIGFRVVDNGEGKNAPADQVSLMYVGVWDGFADAYCNGIYLAPVLVDIESGNIQVK